MKQQLKGNKMSLPKPRPKNLKKKKIGDDLISGIKSFFTGSKKKVPENNKSPIRKLADAKTAKKNKLIKSQKESTNFMGKKADATVDPRMVKKAKPKKGPVVTKEQLKKSGLSLRDYMNYQQGKTRKSGPVVPKRVAPSAGAGNVKKDERKRNVPINKKTGGPLTQKKKPVQRKNIGKMLETFSPAYSIMKGKGPTSKIASALGKTGLSPIGSLAMDKREEAKKRSMAMSGANRMSSADSGSNRMTPMTGMMAGGPVKRSRSIDGCAMKGKTRAK
jgi:hypothetical protein